MAEDYDNIGGLLLSKKEDKKEALESFSNALMILKELEKETRYHYPLIEKVQERISLLEQDDKLRSGQI